jgi:peptidyl-prolyl cis-trans isomerase B (cyclophilin B)
VKKRALGAACVIVGGMLLLSACGGKAAKTVDVGQGPGNAKATPGTAVVQTSEGTFAFRLDVADSPHAVASFEYLARKKFFAGTVFHRIVPNFVIQGGEPTGSNDGGPGYSTHDKVPGSTTYLHGTVAMAKTETDPPGTAGSQFFVVTERDAELPPIYAVIGHVTSGLAIVDKIGTFGNAQTELPTKRIVVQSITIKPS